MNRKFFNLILVVSFLLWPSLSSFLLALVGMFFYRNYWEGLAILFLLDMLYVKSNQDIFSAYILPLGGICFLISFYGRKMIFH